MIWSTSDFKEPGTGWNNCNFFHNANMITITASTASTIQILCGLGQADLRSSLCSGVDRRSKEGLGPNIAEVRFFAVES